MLGSRKVFGADFQLQDTRAGGGGSKPGAVSQCPAVAPSATTSFNNTIPSVFSESLGCRTDVLCVIHFCRVECVPRIGIACSPVSGCVKIRSG